ncbi:N6-adenine-specific methylase [Bifidobacterium italicum]|uniref:N6-adenine-specific methylase n=1 Tax=Bifidobacterium italicum TaxID=1960968 RepID=A0A2A2ELR2_9BIFI|nr:SAM-dependent methyltransferase [Bifidobacterium italicum]PAU69868.1 N6-adenine-specific methylase [Bifidobacterium italicum]
MDNDDNAICADDRMPPCIDEATRAFIAAHQDEDVRDVALHAKRDGDVDVPFALDQIAGRRTARSKLPRWAANDGIIYPPHVPMEQCSSQPAAEYKARLAAELIAGRPHPTTLVDLTGGFGVDFSFMARAFDEAVYVERQPRLCALAGHNLRELGVGNARVVCDDGVAFLEAMPPATLIYVDPARRDAHGARTVAIADCTPDVLALRDALLGKAPFVVVKLSPMLDWRQTIDDFGGAVRRLDIVAVHNECKEILVVLDRERTERPLIRCVDDGACVEFRVGDDERPAVAPSSALPGMRFLYEPNAAIMKGGAFATLQRRWPAAQIGVNSHLFVADRWFDDFPGRAFVIDGIGTMNKKDVRRLLDGVRRANVAVRNFPLMAAQLAKKLKLADGGDVYVFATTDDAGRHILIRAHKRN